MAFRITGDRVGSTFAFLLQDADDRFTEKRYNACVVTLGQVWEAFLRLFVVSTYAYHPFVRSSAQTFFPPLKELNAVRTQLRRTLTTPRKLAFDQLRHLCANTVIHDINPETMAAARSAIAKISAQRFANRPSNEQIESIADPVRREMIRGLYRLTIGNVRNRCVHHAYSPTRIEADTCREAEIVFLFSLKREFKVGELLELQCGAA